MAADRESGKGNNTFKNQPGVQEPSRVWFLIRLCAVIVAGVGLVALLGWVFGLPFLSGLGSGMIPVAPSTAVMFVLYAGVIYLRTHLQKSRVSYWAGVSINAAGALIAAVLLVLSLLGIRTEAEHLGFSVVNKPGELQAGHMSPVTAFCFLLSSLSYFLSLPSSRDRRRVANISWWLACCVIATSSTLVLAYLYGTPILYGSAFIPPAALTSMAFMALGIALLALAALRAWPSRPNVESSTRASYTFLLVFVLLASGLVSAGFLYYRNYEIHYRTEVEFQLSAIADLKTDVLVHWRKERMGDGELFYKNLNFLELVRRYLQTPEDGETGRKLRTWLQHVRDGYQYDRVFLLDAAGRERMSAPTARMPLSRHLLLRAAEVLRAKQVTFEDFYRNEYDGRVYLVVLTPILDERDDGRAVGTLVLRIAPEQYLYPFLNRWPTPSNTAETLLVRREGNEALFLNDLRFKKNTALNLHISLDQKDSPAAQAALGRQGIMEGRDYRGVPVLADVHAVPGSPWFLVSRMDISEVYGPMREKLWMTVIFVITLLTGAGAAFWMVWRRQLAQFYRIKYEATAALSASEVRYRRLFEAAKDGILILDAETGMVVDVNPFLIEMLSFSHEAFLGKKVWELGFFKNIVASQDKFAELQKKEYIRYEDMPLETADGRRIEVEFVSNVYLVNNQKVIQCNIRDITERKRADEAVRESGERLREAQKMAQLGSWRWDVRTGDVEWSEEVFRIFQLDPGKFIPRIDSILELSPWPEDHERDKELIRKAMANHENGFYEQRFLRPDGSIGYYYSTFQGEYDGGGNLIFMIGTVQDITERKQREEELQRLNRTLLAHSKSSMAMMNARDEAWYLNEVCRIIVEDCGHALVWIGYAEQDEGRSVRPVAHAGFEEGYLDSMKITWSDTDRGRGPVGTAIRTGKPSVIRNILGDPAFAPWREEAVKRGYAAVIGVPLLAEGKAYGSLNIYSRHENPFSDDEVQLLNDLAADLSYGIAAIRMRSAQAKAESALRESEAQFRKLYQEFHGLLDAVPDSLMLLDKDLKVLWANRVAADSIGADPEALTGQFCHSLWYKRTTHCDPCPVIESFSTGRPLSVIVTRPDGRIFDIRTVPLADESGSIARVIEVVREITEHRRLEAQYLHAQKMESIGTLAGGVAHDFNNILSAIIGYGHVTLMKMAGDDPLRSNIEHMLEAADRAARLTKELLLFSRKQVSERKPVNMNEVVSMIAKFLKMVIGEDIECKTMLQERPLPVYADSRQLEQVLMNLATNARDAMPRGGIFTVKTEQINMTEDFTSAHGYGKAGSYAKITISDTGIGMDEVTQKRIFEPFYTTKEVGKGTGLGLAVVYGIIKNHDGFINVYSEPGRGTTFRIYLPLIATEAAEKTVPRLEDAPARGTETVLLAEDDKNLRKLSRTVLAEFGYTVIEAVDGAEAVEKFMENKDTVQLLLFDLVMPKMNGKEAADEIKKIKPDMKVLFASGYDPDLLQQKELLGEGVHLVYKPITPMDLLRRVRSVLDGVA